MTTATEMSRTLSARAEAVRSRLSTKATADSILLAQNMESLEAALTQAAPILTACGTGPTCAELQRQIEAARVTLNSAARDLAGTGAQPTTPPRTGRSGGGGGGGGGGLPVLPPDATGTEPTVWSQLFPEGSPWYQQPGYLIGGAVALGTVAIVLSVASSKKAKAGTQEA